jgi:hypothetical protein
VVLRLVFLLVLPLLTAAASADDALNAVLAALSAERAAPAAQSRIFVQRAQISDLYLIDRVGSTKLHLTRNPTRVRNELFIVDGFIWTRTADGWKKSPAPDVSKLRPPLEGVVKTGITDISEQTPIDGNRVFVGTLSWPNDHANTGRFEIRIDAAGLPRIVHFDGNCAGSPCRIHEMIDFDSSVAISAPD